jgi:hypothetical protein
MLLFFFFAFSRNQYKFQVLAVDQGEPPLTAIASVVIRVLDVNDVAPHFNVISYYNMSVMENAQVGAVVGNVSANDPDTGTSMGPDVCVTHHTSIIDSSII